MKIFSRKQIYEADQATAKKEGIPTINLMERAGGYIYEWVHQRLQGGAVPIKVFCGIGNNGGDGMVLARYLVENNYNVTVYVVNYNDKRVPDFLEAYSRLKQATSNWPIVLTESSELPEIDKNDIIVDAIFGIGLNRPPQDWLKKLFTKINASQAYVLSIDIPSGMYMDMTPQDDDVIINARFTLSFQSPKLPFFLPKTAELVPMWDILDIGLDPEYLNVTATDVELIGKPEAQQLYKGRTQFNHKGTFGHSLLIGGSHGKMGSIVLATKAAMRVGSGLATALVPKIGMAILQTSVPEAIVVAQDNGEFTLSSFSYDSKVNAIAIGMGLGTDADTVVGFKDFLTEVKIPLVIDADALNIIAQNDTLLSLIPAGSILTPHPGELERLIGTWEDDFDKLEKTAKFAKKYDIVVLIKGAHTVTVYDMKLYINDSGNPGLATGGTGDVLSGMIAGLLAQKYNPLEAALLGVYLHGSTADIAINQFGVEGLLAGDVVNFIGRSYIELFAQPEQQGQQQPQ